MLEKPLHFPIKPGVVAAWNASTVVIGTPREPNGSKRGVVSGCSVDASQETSTRQHESSLLVKP
jgi:hypothetical protein